MSRILSLQATHAFDRMGARKTAELIRRDGPRASVDDVVASALVELTPEDFRAMVREVGCYEVVIDALCFVWPAVECGPMPSFTLAALDELIVRIWSSVRYQRGKTLAREIRDHLSEVAELRPSVRHAKLLQSKYDLIEVAQLAELIALSHDAGLMQQLLLVHADAVSHRTAIRIQTAVRALVTPVVSQARVV